MARTLASRPGGCPRVDAAKTGAATRWWREMTPTFHPKLVVVRFVRSGAPTRIRVVCMSRNLTTDAALDVSAVIEGEASGPDPAQGSDRLARAIETLLAWAVRPDHRDASGDLVRSIASTLRETRWQPPAGFQTVTFQPYGFGELPDRAQLEADEHRLLVISPFLSPARLRRLTRRGGGHVLVSDPAALIEVGTKSLKGFAETFHLASTADFTMASAAAERARGGWRQVTVTGLHAKLYVAEGRRHARWLIGSGNATEAAVTGNAELLVELRSAKKAARIDALIDPVDGLGRHLVPYTPDPTAPEEPTTQRNEAEIALRALVSSTFRGRSQPALMAGANSMSWSTRCSARPPLSHSPRVCWGLIRRRLLCGPTAFPPPASRVSRAGTSALSRRHRGRRRRAGRAGRRPGAGGHHSAGAS